MKKILPLLVPLLSLLPFGCGEVGPTRPGPVETNGVFTITIPALHRDSVRFSYTVQGGKRFILPFHFFDNPGDSIRGDLATDIMIIDSTGTVVDADSSRAFIGPIENNIIELPGNVVYPVTFSYRFNPSAVRRDTIDKMMPLVHVNDTSLFLIGAYCFIIPELSASLTGLWRTPQPTTVVLAHPDALPVYGVPAESFTVPNIYNLLFLQLSSGRTPLANGSGGGVQFVFLDFTGASRAPGLLDSVTTLFSGILDRISPSYGEFSGAPYAVSIHNIWGGLEGTCGFAVTEPVSTPDSRFGEILAHEALHHFIGIRCGEYDDQWWKESAATYLGLELMVRTGFYNKAYFRQRMTTPFIYADTARFQRALSDPWLRENMFPQILYGLVYELGAQVMMLLDVRIRTATNNSFTLFEVMGELCRRYNGGAFDRSALLALLEIYGVNDASDFFAAYIDNSNPSMPEEVLTAAFDELEKLAGYE
jgi:hypothetical protein